MCNTVFWVWVYEVIKENFFPLCMVTDLYHFVSFEAKARNMSFCSYFNFRGKDTKYARRNNNILAGGGTKIFLLKISCWRVEIFRVVALCLLCLLVFAWKHEGRSNNKKTCFHIFAFRGKDIKTQNGINQPPYLCELNNYQVMCFWFRTIFTAQCWFKWCSHSALPGIIEQKLNFKNFNFFIRLFLANLYEITLSKSKSD